MKKSNDQMTHNPKSIPHHSEGYVKVSIRIDHAWSLVVFWVAPHWRGHVFVSCPSSPSTVGAIRGHFEMFLDRSVQLGILVPRLVQCHQVVIVKNVEVSDHSLVACDFVFKDYNKAFDAISDIVRMVNLEPAAPNDERQNTK